MMRRHLKIAAGAQLELPARQWERLLRATTGHIKIGANAEVRILPDQPREPKPDEETEIT